MKKRVLVSLFLCFILISSLVIISPAWFSDLLTKVTGKATANPTLFGIADESNFNYSRGIGFFLKETSSDKPNHSGYIIQFENFPVLEKKIELEKTAEKNKNLFFTKIPIIRDFFVTSGNLDSKLQSYQKSITAEHNSVKQKINSVIGADSSKIFGEYRDTFNGIALNISDEEIIKIEKIEGVKKVWPNMEVQSFLNDSVPLVQDGIPAGQLDSKGNDCIETGKRCLTGAGETIVIIDSGIDYTHPDLGGCFGGDCKVAGGYDFVNNDNDPADDYGHGTHVASIAAGNGALKGVAPDARLIAYKVLNGKGVGYDSAIIASIERSVDPNQDGNFNDHYDIISMSFGKRSQSFDDPLITAVNNAIDAGVTAVVAAGNSGPFQNTIATPGIGKNVITVGATDKKDKIANFSSRGPVILKDENDVSHVIIKPDIVAPGVSICAARWDSAFEGRNINCNNDNNHVAISGTSMATPHVSGAVALIKQAHPDWSPLQIKSALLSSSDYISSSMPSNGQGRLNIVSAIKMKNPLIVQILTDAEPYENIAALIEGNSFSNYSVYLHKFDGNYNLLDSQLVKESTSLPNPYVLTEQDFKPDQESYVLELRARNNEGEQYADYLPVTFNFIRFAPGQDIPYKQGSLINITGTISPPDLHNYRVDYVSADRIEYWKHDGITESNSGLNAVTNSIIATFDTTNLNPGRYIIRLTTSYKEKTDIQFLVIYISDKNNNWHVPVNLDPSRGDVEVATGDINADGQKELIVAGSDSNKLTVYSFNKDGSLINGFPLTLLNRDSLYGLTVVDVDNNGRAEILLVYDDNENGFYFRALNGDGTDYIKEMKSLGSYKLSRPPTVADINGDGKNEIILIYSDPADLSSNMGTKIIVLNQDGTILWQKFSQYIQESPAIGDINNDGQNEIIFESINLFADDINLHVFNGNGSYLPGWPKKLWGQGIIGGAILLDADGDKIPEIIYSHLYDTGSSESMMTYHIFKYDGTEIANYPQNLSVIHSHELLASNFGNSNPIIVQASDYVQGNAYGNLFVTEVNNPLNRRTFEGGTITRQALINRDINGDLRFLVLGYDESRIFDSEGQSVLNISHPGAVALATYDPLNSGKNDLVIMEILNGRSYMDIIPDIINYDKDNQEWPMQYHDAGNSRNYNYAILPSLKKQEMPTPGNLKAELINFNSILVTWDGISQVNSSYPKSGYYLLRAENNSWKQLGTQMPSGYQDTNLIDANLLPETVYKYKIVAYNSNIQSNPSDEVSVTTPGINKSLEEMPTPGNLKAELINFNSILVTWDGISQVNSSYPKSGYYLLRAENNSWKQLGTQMPSGYQDTNLIDANLLPETVYKYKIVAYNSNIQSNPSDEVSVTTPDTF